MYSYSECLRVDISDTAGEELDLTHATVDLLRRPRLAAPSQHQPPSPSVLPLSLEHLPGRRLAQRLHTATRKDQQRRHVPTRRLSTSRSEPDELQRWTRWKTTDDGVRWNVRESAHPSGVLFKHFTDSVEDGLIPG